MIHAPQPDHRVLIALCALAALAMAPFSAYHLASAAWPMAAVTGAVVAFTIAAIPWLYSQRNDLRMLQRTGTLIVLIANASFLLSTVLKPDTTFYWLYPLIFINFYLLSLPAAATINVLGSAITLWLVHGVVPDQHQARLMGSIPLCLFFGLVFSLSIAGQRRELEHLAHHDVLTGVGNRLALDAELEKAVARRQRYGERCSLAIFDIDRFKAINDSVGHLTGDAILAEFAGLLDRRIRKTDRLFRYGGEEFIFVFPHTGVRDAERAAESLRAAVEEQRFGGERRMTASAGVAELGAGEDVERWLGRADRALYAAKQAGRNRVMAADSSAPADQAREGAERLRGRTA